MYGAQRIDIRYSRLPFILNLKCNARAINTRPKSICPHTIIGYCNTMVKLCQERFQRELKNELPIISRKWDVNKTNITSAKNRNNAKCKSRR